MDKYGAAGAFKGKAGVYEHFYSNGDDIVSYTGKTTDLGGSRPGKSRRVRGCQAGKMDENYEYMGSRYTALEGSDAKNLGELESKTLNRNGGASDPNTLNKNDILTWH